jgi:hypothetical protein
MLACARESILFSGLCLLAGVVAPACPLLDSARAAEKAPGAAAEASSVGFRVQLDVVTQRDKDDWIWFHPRAASVRDANNAATPTVLITIQKHLGVSDYYSGIHVMRTDDMGKSWTGPELVPQLDWWKESEEVRVSVCDATPGWHGQAAKLIAIGTKIRYDSKELGSYNTQQHWLGHAKGLFLVYTRRGANNDHVMRHRAPLFIGQVDPARLHVIRKTERVLVPERGAPLGNFGATTINENESWVTVSEFMWPAWNDKARAMGARGATFVARILWDEPNQ